MSEWKETELGLIPSNWDVKLVDALVEDGILDKPMDGNHGNIHPKGEDFIESGIPFIMASDVANGKVDIKNCKFIAKEQADKLQKGFSKEGDVLLTHKATLGRTAIVKNIVTPYIMLTPQVTYYRVLNDKLLSNKFLRLYFDSNIFQGILENHGSSGSTRAYIGITAQRQLPILLPPLPEQKAIAETLSSLDDKIDLLHRQNNTLEQMAETLFRQWFIEEAKEDWELTKIKDFPVIVTDYVANGSFASLAENVNYKNEPDYAVLIRLTDYNNGFKNNFVYVDEHAYNFLAKSKLDGGEIIISNVGAYSGTVFKCPKLEIPMTLGPNSIVLKSDYNNFFYLYFTSDYGQYLLDGIISGSAQPKFNKTAFRNIEIQYPNINHIAEFENLVKPYFEKLDFNKNQIRTLEKMRDIILPKLMSGEISINN